jgi:hypothetical protein
LDFARERKKKIKPSDMILQKGSVMLTAKQIVREKRK